jgi:hypothetical protein
MHEVRDEKIKPNWEALIAEQEKSGLTQEAFCKERDVVLTKFVYYRSQIKKKAKSTQQSPLSFSPVKVAKKEEIVGSEIRLSLPNGFQCAFPTQLEISQIKRLVEALLSC